MASRPTPDRVSADLVLLGATLGWGTTFAIVKDALADASPAAFLAVRFAIGTAAAALLARSSLRDRTSLKLGGLLGLLLFLGFALQTFGLRYTSATRSGFVSGLCVVLVPIVGALAFRARAHAASWLGAGLAGCGLFLMSAPALRGDAGGSLLGDGLTLLSTVSYAFHILFTERFSPRVKPMAAVTAQLAVVALLSTALLPFEEVQFHPTRMLVGTLLFTGVFASAIFIYLQMWAQARTSAVRAALIFSLEPIVAAVFSYLIVHDPLVKETLLGGGLIVAGILVAELWPRLEGRRAVAAAPPASDGNLG